MTDLPKTYLQMHSTVTEDAQLRLSLVEKEMKMPNPDQVLVKVEATPINPSDHGVMFGISDVANAVSTGEGKDRVLTIPVPPIGMQFMKGRMGKPQQPGNEGSGIVVAAGDSPYAQSLLGKRVGGMGGGMYGEYRLVNAMMCLPLKDEHTAKDGASCFVNPLTALSFFETMRGEGHKAIIHSAAASNLGQMLNRIGQADGVDIVNIVRRKEQVDLLKGMGAKYVVNSSDDNFMKELIDAIDATGATLGFDATGGGKMASDMLFAMEQAALRTPSDYSVYGSTRFKQIYIYGRLDTSQTTLNMSYGFSWSLGAWLLPRFLEKAGMETAVRLRQRVANELTTTFASHYTDEISLVDALDADVARRYNAKKTGEKFLIIPG